MSSFSTREKTLIVLLMTVAAGFGTYVWFNRPSAADFYITQSPVSGETGGVTSPSPSGTPIGPPLSQPTQPPINSSFLQPPPSGTMSPPPGGTQLPPPPGGPTPMDSQLAQQSPPPPGPPPPSPSPSFSTGTIPTISSSQPLPSTGPASFPPPNPSGNPPSLQQPPPEGSSPTPTILTSNQPISQIDQLEGYQPNGRREIQPAKTKQTSRDILVIDPAIIWFTFGLILLLALLITGWFLYRRHHGTPSKPVTNIDNEEKPPLQ